MTFAPRYAPDSSRIIFSMAVNGNTDIYTIPVAGGTPTRLTNTPGIDTGGSFSPDGRRIVFESDRSGTQQLYVMDADGSNQRRISFGGGGYATPVWSPRGDLIAFTRTGGFRIGVMTPGRLGRAHPDQRRLCRGAELGAQRPRGDVHPRRQRRASSGMSTSPRARSAGARPRSADRTRPGRRYATDEFRSEQTREEKKMKMRLTSLLAIAAALSLTAGCATPAPPSVPPDPPTDHRGHARMTALGNDGGRRPRGPGSRADFLQSVPADRVFFELDSYSIDAEDRATLDAQAAWLTRYPNVRVTIEGHADERGTREYNLALGDRRANAARDYLQSRGIAPARMTVISWGKERPQDPASNEDAWAQNRRAVTVVPE